MNPILIIVIAVVALAASPLIVRAVRRRRLVAAINVGTGVVGTTPGGNKTLLSSAAIAIRFSLVKRGADDEHVAVCTATTDIAIGVCTDAPSAAEEPVNVALFGGAAETRIVYVGADVVMGAELVPHASGGCTTLPATTGTYNPFGRALHAKTATNCVEFVPVSPTPRVVA